MVSLPATHAFSLIEMIGVLAVIAILAAALVPNVIRRMDIAARQRETSDLKVMADGLVKTILTDKQITAQAGLPAAIAKYLDLSLNQVTNTPRRFDRLFLVDPSLTINGGGLPYSQGSGGSAGQTSARIMILSAIAGPAVTNITDTFSTIWNTTNGGKPPTWTGKADDLCIQRVELGSLFHKVSLLNTETISTRVGNYQLEANTVIPVTANGGQTNIYVLHGTALNLYAAQVNLQMRIIVNRDESYVYQNDRWSLSLSPNQPDLTLDPETFGDWVSQFLNAAAPPFSAQQFGATQRGIVDEFYNFLWSYWSWGEQGFIGFDEGTSAEPHNPYFRTASDSQGRLDEYTHNLLR